MVLQFGSLRRPRQARDVDEPVIDLSDAAEDAEDPVLDEDCVPNEVAEPGEAAEAEDGARDDPQVLLSTAEEQPAPDGSMGAAARMAGLLVLSRGVSGGYTPAAGVAIASAWLLAVVVLGCLAVTAVAGFIAEDSLFDPAIFVSSWRIAHLMPVEAAAGPVSLVPLLPACLVLLLMLRASSWLWAALQTSGRPTAIRGTAAHAAVYLTCATLLATSPTSTGAPAIGADPTGAQAAPAMLGWAGLFGLVLCGFGWPWLAHALRPNHPRVWHMLRAVRAVLVVILTSSVLVLLLSLLGSWGQVQELTTALLDSGTQPATRLDTIALGAIQLAYLPNLVVWIAAYLIGAGFAVGTDTIVSPFTVVLGTLPEVPLTALLPSEPLPMPWLPPVLIACGSLVAGTIIRGAGLAWRMRTRIVVGAAIAAIAAICLAVLAAASAGGLGPGLLEVVGPNPWVTGVWTFLVVGMGQFMWAVFPTLVADLDPFVAQARNAAAGLRRRRPHLPRVRVRRPRRRRSKADRRSKDQMRQT